jgi:hypothetical protein
LEEFLNRCDEASGRLITKILVALQHIDCDEKERLSYGEVRFATNPSSPNTTIIVTLDEFTEEGLAKALEEGGSNRRPAETKAALVRTMIKKGCELIATIAIEVHKDPGASKSTIKQNCIRTNKEAEILGYPFRYKVKGGYVRKSDIRKHEGNIVKSPVD